MTYPAMIVLFFLMLSLPILASDKPNVKASLPSYSVIMDAQLHCDDSEWKKYPWEKRKTDLSLKLAYKAWSILSNVSLTEEKREKKPEDGEHRDFKLSYHAHARLFCGEAADILEEREGRQYTTLPAMDHPTNRDDLIRAADDDRPPLEFAYHFYWKYGDLPNPPGLEGMSCIVRLEDFLKDPLKSIDLKKLCKGESKKKIAFTKKEILRVAALLKTKVNASKEKPKIK